MRLAVIGASGQLGREVTAAVRAAGHAVFPFGHEDVEVGDPRSVEVALFSVGPEAVVNCAGFVRVDECEERPEDAFRVNAVGALHVARACERLRALCVYIGTDYVFDGDKEEAYTEEDAPRPINVYGASKFAGEVLTTQGCSRWLCVRTSSLFGRGGARGKGGNFVDTIVARALRGEPLSVVSDIRMSPTYARDVAAATVELAGRGVTGVVHVANRGACSWYELARRALELCGLPAELRPVGAAQWPARACRPRNSALASARREVLAVELRSWEEALAAYLEETGRIPTAPRSR